ncbi:MAG: SDR family oxidoreductase [Anaerolineales bacterium]
MTDQQHSASARVALITGASSGIGRATAFQLAKQGVRLGLLGRTEDELQDTQAQLADQGAESIILLADISHPDELQSAINRLDEAMGRIDIVFANAGINGTWAGLDELSPEEWDQTLNINLKGTFMTVKYALPALKRRGGAVVVTSSVNGTRVFSKTGATAYACSKAGQVAFVKMTAPELARDGIRINVICPGAIDTDIMENTDQEDSANQLRLPIEYPQGKIPLTGQEPGTSAQVAELVCFLASPAASHITGTEVWIDGGQSLLS